MQKIKAVAAIHKRKPDAHPNDPHERKLGDDLLRL